MAIAFQYIVREPGRDAHIAGRRISVYTILCLRETGETPEAIAEDYNLPLAAVYEALAYAAERPDEMDAIRQADNEASREVLLRVPEHLRRELPEEVRRALDLPR